jgi:excisionase family DNA binding protein
MPTEAPTRLLTVADVIEETKLSRSTVARAMRAGDLPRIKVGRAVRIKREALEAWLTQAGI